jgi:hypothetical protein
VKNDQGNLPAYLITTTPQSTLQTVRIPQKYTPAEKIGQAEDRHSSGLPNAMRRLERGNSWEERAALATCLSAKSPGGALLSGTFA